MCVYLLNAGVGSKVVHLSTGNFKSHCHFRSEVYHMVESEHKDEVTTVERELKLEKELVFFGELNNCTITFTVGSKRCTV